MKDFLLSSSGDVSIMDDIEMVSGENELAQSVHSILSMKLGEFCLEKETGLDTENMLGKNYNEEYLKQDISWAITDQEKRIVSVSDIEISKTNRNLSIRIKMIATSEKEIEVIVSA
ncbi:DUF2634 domain-containing protein [Enterococcus plantarum]|uniref:DUF2634 domain-containing protein n=1 Tax=Enterococcus plantarum TaxID=1077675 RepID=A0A2W3ZFE9_9ENTE|nr:DUF2634 domain-containing protein [Enterococcus plantarum]PZL78256.1 DUF2634 domain-containing protein [Enterococcus plantarum]